MTKYIIIIDADDKYIKYKEYIQGPTYISHSVKYETFIKIVNNIFPRCKIKLVDDRLYSISKDEFNSYLEKDKLIF